MTLNEFLSIDRIVRRMDNIEILKENGALRDEYEETYRLVKDFVSYVTKYTKSDETSRRAGLILKLLHGITIPVSLIESIDTYEAKNKNKNKKKQIIE